MTNDELIKDKQLEILTVALEKRDAELERCGQLIFDLKKKIQRLVEERDSARWEVCELSGNGSIDSAMRVAEEREWNLTEDDDGIGFDPHAEAWAARAEEGKKRQEDNPHFKEHKRCPF